MERRSAFAVLVVVVGVAVAGVVVGPRVLPEQSTTVDDETGEGTVLKSGTFTGKTGHQVSGTVALVRDDEGLFLQFRNYSQTQGPDVYVYLTPASDPDTAAEVAAGRKVLIDGGADGGESTKEGIFVQRLPDDVDPDAYAGVAIWCDDFGVPFGAATLEAP